MKKRWKHKITACMLSFAMVGTLLPYHPLGIEGMKKAEAASVEIKDTAEIYETVTKQHVTVHDPSIVVGYEDKDGKVYPDMAEGRTKVYYIFGSHMAWAYSYDLENWKTFTNNINKDYAKIFEKGAKWSAQGNANYDVSGNLWAPDVIWSPDYVNKDGSKGAWLMYMSVNGASWNSSIALLTSDSLNGDWTYADTVIYSGFTAAGNNLYTETDYKEVTGETELGSRYQTSDTVWNMRYGAHAIDACVFYDEAGKMWMSYGSWSGGIYIIELDEATGLRDKKVSYENTDTSDPYMGTKLGGSTASGEASYIEHIGNYYYMFLSYGGLVANGGYNMRVFRSENPDGPYTDFTGHEAVKGGGTNGNIGTRLMSYYKWSWWDYAQVAQGHNSAFVDTDGNAYVIYHTRTNDGTEGHSVRVHQLFTTQNEYLVAAPFEYSSTDEVKESYTKDEVVGDYEILFQYNTNNEKLEYNADKHIVLNSDGTVTGDVTGSWSLVDGKPYASFTIDNITYEGIFVEQMMENTNIKTLCFTAVGTNNICFWGAKYPSDAQAVSLAADSLTLPEYVSDDIVLPAEGILGTSIIWESDSTSILSDGTVIPPAVDRSAVLTATITRGDYTHKKKINITVLAEVDEESGPVKIASYYTDVPLDLSDGTQTSFENPFKGRDISNGVFLRFKTKRNGDGSFLSNIFSFGTGNSQEAAETSNGRLYFTGGSYLGYNAAGGYFDANVNNTAWTAGNDYIGNGKEVQFEIQLKPSGFSVWVDGEEAYNQDHLKAGTVLGGSAVQDYSNVLSWLSETATYLNFGFGSWWKDVYNGAVWDFEAWAEPVVKGSIAANEYYHEDYEGSTNLTGLWSGNATVSKETEDGNKYVKIAPNGSGNRSSKCAFGLSTQPAGELHFDTDIILQSSVGNNGSTTPETIFQLVCTDGYILKLYAQGTKNQKFVINDRAGDTVELPASSWVHIHVGMNTEDLSKAVLTIINRETAEKLVDQKEIAVVGNGEVSGISITVGRGTDSRICLDNTILSKPGMADYTEFQEALKRAQKHLRLDIYTEESAKALQAAVDAANDLPKDLMDSQQETVDAATVKLTEALSGLICKIHAYNEGTIKTKPACTLKGSKEVICYQCGEKTEIEVEPLGHDFAAEFTIDKEATCKEDGSKSRHCSRCTEVTEVTPIDKSTVEHTWDEGKVTKEPTCTEKGTTTYACTVCAAEKEEELPMIDHNWTAWTTSLKPTVEAPGQEKRTCTVCGKEETREIPKLALWTGFADVSGDIVYGSVVSAQAVVEGELREGTRLDYQWYRADSETAEGSKIEGATEGTYTLTKEDIGTCLSVEISSESYAGALERKNVGPVEKRRIQIDKAVVKNKVYDAATKAAIEELTFVNLADGDEIDYEASAEFASPNAGQNIKAFVTVTLKGDSEACYSLEKDTAETAAEITKADPVCTIPTGLTATEGQTLKDVALPKGFAFKDALTTSVGTAGVHKFPVCYTPEDTENYNTVEVEVEITVTVRNAGGGSSASGGGTTGGGSTGGITGGITGGTGGSSTDAAGSGEKEDTATDSTDSNTDITEPSDENTDQTVATETKEDGTKVETVKETGQDGTVKETVTETKTDGTVSVTSKETKKDGSLEETKEIKTADGSAVLVTTVKVTADGKTSAASVISTGTSKDSGKVAIPEQLLASVVNDGRVDGVVVAITDATVNTAEKAGKSTIVSVEIPSVEGVEVEKIILTRDSIAAAKETGKGLTVNVINGADYTVNIPAKQLKKIGSGVEEINVSITAEKVTAVNDSAKKTKITKLVNNNKGKKEKTYVVSVAENKDVKAGMNVTVPVTEMTAITNNSNVYIYKYDAETGKLYETANCRQKVASDGTVAIAAASGTDYVVSAKKLSGSGVETIKDHISVSVAKKTAKAGKNIAVKVSLPDCVSTKTKFGTEKAVITYKSSNSKVASVSADGVIKAKKAGNVMITVTVKLAGGQKVVEKQKVKVK